MSKKPNASAAAAEATAAPAAAPAAKKITPVAKISVKSVSGTPQTSKLPPLRINVTDENPEGDPNPNAEMHILRVAGYANTVKSGTSNYGEWRALVGEAAATDMSTGEVFVSKACILPGSIHEALCDTLTEKLREDAAAQIRYKVDVFVKRSARDKNKYEYVCRPVIEHEFQSPALALLTAE